MFLIYERIHFSFRDRKNIFEDIRATTTVMIADGDL